MRWPSTAIFLLPSTFSFLTTSSMTGMGMVSLNCYDLNFRLTDTRSYGEDLFIRTSDLVSTGWELESICIYESWDASSSCWMAFFISRILDLGAFKQWTFFLQVSSSIWSLSHIWATVRDSTSLNNMTMAISIVEHTNSARFTERAELGVCIQTTACPILKQMASFLCACLPAPE